jgi:outer membrane protein OmpA-like peptidoglycan-associated protein
MFGPRYQRQQFRARRVAAVIAAILIAGSSLDRALADSAAPVRQKASRPETTGVLSGLAIGAAAAGPVGALAGAAAGGWLGDRLYGQKELTQSLSRELKSQLAERSRMGSEIERLNTALARVDAESTNRAQALADLRANSIPLNELAANVHIRTRDTALDAPDQDQLRQLGAVLAERTDRVVFVTGYADARGAMGYNFELSTARAEAVADAMVDGGLARGQVVVRGAGAPSSSDCLRDTDRCALERRVTVRMVATGDDAGDAVDTDVVAQVTP